MPIVREILPITLARTSKLRVAAYCRVSSDSEDQLNSYLAQVEEYTVRINSNSEWVFVDIYADEGTTGTRMDNRNDFNRMLKACRRGKIDLILVKSITRFARNNKECLEVLRELKSLNVGVIFENLGVDTRQISSEMMVSLYSTLAQEESLSTSQNVRKFVQVRMRSGIYKLSVPPYGYDLKNGKLVINSEESKIVKEIFGGFLMGKTRKQIAESFNDRGLTFKGKTWKHQTIAYILTNEKYIGDSLLQKRFKTDELPFRFQKNRGEKEKIIIHGSHTQIIERDCFELVQNLIKQRTPINPNQYDGVSKRPLTSKIKCTNCDKNYKRRILGGEIVWGCATYETLGKKHCPANRVTEQEVYMIFIRLCQRLKDNPEILSSLLSQLQELQSQNAKYDGKIIEINKRIAELKAQNEMYTHMQAENLMDSAILMSQINGIQAQIQTLQTERKQMIDKDDDESILKTKNIISTLNAVGDIKEFNALIFSNTIEKIEIDDNNLTFNLKNGLKVKEVYAKRSRNGR